MNVIDRVRAEVDAYHADRLAVIAAHERKPGTTYDPVVPALHPWKRWPDPDPGRYDPPKRPFPASCGFCGLEPPLHEGWQRRAEVNERYRGFDRYDLLLVIAALEEALDDRP